MSYKYITNLKANYIRKKSVLIIGSGYIAEEYAKVFHILGINDVTIIGNTKKKVNKLCKKFNFSPYDGGFNKNLPNIEKKDLVIVATPIPLLLKTTELAIKTGQNNILIEKPGTLNSKNLKIFAKKTSTKNLRLGYNRLCYPSLHKLKQLVKNEGGITSCRFSFTEWVHKINFKSYSKIVYSRWGISNSLHVISLVLNIIGMPEKINCTQLGSLPWHKSGAIFVGSGISKKKIPFSYHSDWYSAGRWGIEVMTRENSYRLSPLETLSRCKKGSTKWKNIPLKKAFPRIKEGLAEEIFAMLDKKSKLKLTTLKEGSSYIETAEKIFGY